MKIHHLVFSIALIAIVIGQIAAYSTIWPQPSTIRYVDKKFRIVRQYFEFFEVGATSEILTRAQRRYTHIIFRNVMTGSHGNQIFDGIQHLTNPDEVIYGLKINVKSDNTEIFFGVDESYTLDTTQPSYSLLTANTVYGAIRGLESFSQLVDRDFYLTAAYMEDTPRFAHRSFMIDTARHYYPVNIIYQQLDAMAYNKMNILHWHIVDDQSYPYLSEKYPEMARSGAFSYPSHIYTKQDIVDIQRYANDRGIRVIPEFDTPGHCTRGYEALEPPILTNCQVSHNSGSLNPTLEATYEFLDNFYEELKTVFWDKYVHIGGDEVIHRCWASDPQIQQWMKEHPEIPDYKALEQYFARRLIEILQKKGYSYMVWEEIFKNGADIQKDTVIEVWDDKSWQEVMSNVHKKGFKSVLAAPFYLNYISYGPDWKKYYAVEPTDFPGGDAVEESIAGVSVTMWSEYVDSTNFMARTWPRASAVAERAWSPKNVTDVVNAQERIQEFRCKMIRRGIDAQPADNGADMAVLPGRHHCPDEWNPRYVPIL